AGLIVSHPNGAASVSHPNGHQPTVGLLVTLVGTTVPYPARHALGEPPDARQAASAQEWRRCRRMGGRRCTQQAAANRGGADSECALLVRTVRTSPEAARDSGPSSGR